MDRRISFIGFLTCPDLGKHSAYRVSDQQFGIKNNLFFYNPTRFKQTVQKAASCDHTIKSVHRDSLMAKKVLIWSHLFADLSERPNLH